VRAPATPAVGLVSDAHISIPGNECANEGKLRYYRASAGVSNLRGPRGGLSGPGPCVTVACLCRSP
jgi:hypothetical protein